MVWKGARKEWYNAKEEDRSRAQDVLVEDVDDSEGITPVGFSSVNKEKVLQELELSNSVVGCFDGLLALEATDAYTNMRSSDHIDVICSVAYGQSCLFRVTLFNQVHNFSFLFRANTACQHNVRTFAQINKFANKLLVLLNKCKWLACNNYSIFSGLISFALLCVSGFDFISNFSWSERT